MEAAANNENRKRARDEVADNAEILESAKKQECSNPAIHNSLHDDGERRYEFHDGVGVFDFPWLKEGAIFNSVEDEEEETKFAPCLYVDEEITTVAAADCKNKYCSPSQNLCGVDDNLWSLAVDEQEAVDCIWSCVIDQPLDLGFNKLS